MIYLKVSLLLDASDVHCYHIIERAACYCRNAIESAFVTADDLVREC